MDIFVLNQNFEAIDIIDNYESLIWTDRYFEYGDFELYLPMQIDLLASLQKDNYMYIRDSEHLMIIEDFEITTDAEIGSRLRVIGRSLESILDRRIVWGQKTYSGTIHAIIKAMITDAIISPEIESRKIDNFIFQDSSDESVNGNSIDVQFTGDNLYESVSLLCHMVGAGFRITLDSDNNFVFSLYSGQDRSYAQDSNPYVVFSPSFENIIDSRYVETNSSHRNVTLVAGEGEGSDRKTVTVGDTSGLLRRELFTDARDISTQTEEGTLTDEQYNAQLTARGNESLQEYSASTAFEGKAETTRMFRYGEDFFMGDIVQIANEFGMESRAYITAIIRSQDEKGLAVYPTYETLINEEKEE
jgi:hypothetical protein